MSYNTPINPADIFDSIPADESARKLDQWLATNYETEFFRRELDSFVPDRIFDAHVHLYNQDFVPDERVLTLLRQGPRVVGMNVFHKYIPELTPGRKTDVLCFPYPMHETDFSSANMFVSREAARHPGSRAQMMVEPSMDPDYIRDMVREHGIVGLKPYHFFSPKRPTTNSCIEDFLPEKHVEVAHQEGLAITLHIVRPMALADPVNQQAIKRYAKTYPDMKIVLAHAARGFNPYHTVKGIREIAGLRNVYFDTSAVQEAGGFEAIVETMGHTRLLWGSDFPVSHQRGRCVAVGDGMLWITPEMVNPTDNTLIMHGLESLRALKLACTRLNLTDSKIEDIFYGNAATLFNLRVRES